MKDPRMQRLANSSLKSGHTVDTVPPWLQNKLKGSALILLFLGTAVTDRIIYEFSIFKLLQEYLVWLILTKWALDVDSEREN